MGMDSGTRKAANPLPRLSRVWCLGMRKHGLSVRKRAFENDIKHEKLQGTLRRFSPAWHFQWRLTVWHQGLGQ